MKNKHTTPHPVEIDPDIEAHDREFAALRNKLTNKQAAFAEAIVFEGLPKVRAYQKAYAIPKKTADHLFAMSAAALMRVPKVAAYITQLRSDIRTNSEATAYEKLGILEEQMRDPELSPKDRQNAIKIHNEMTGDNAPTKLDHSFSPQQILDQIRGRAPIN